MPEYRLGRGPRCELGAAVGLCLATYPGTWKRLRAMLVEQGWTPIEVLAEMDARGVDAKWRWETGIDAVLDPESGYWG
jgi:hypothetical protein